jgi:hypothetical protein
LIEFLSMGEGAEPGNAYKIAKAIHDRGGVQDWLLQST